MSDTADPRLVVALALALVLAVAGSRAVGGTMAASRVAGGSWVRLELVENTAEGPAFDRCEVDGVLKGRQVLHSRFLYGEVRKGAGPAWEPVRSRSGCAVVPSGTARDRWTLRATPYLLADIDVMRTPVSGIGTSLQASLHLRRLIEFAGNGTTRYENRTMTFMLHIPPGGVAVVPLMIADERETESFGYARSPVESPSGPETGQSRVSRGGSWVNPSSWVRGAMRQGIDPTWPDPTHGFRCAQEDPAGVAR